ncbi:DNA-dependent kinase catalytic subunit-like protein, putative [Babesia ovata]|uniref:DNA-dependent kinase catalytic subunit-like protein, putative n=1 Tax=Babesia ovata TaxID=189622 RepID=A0A2H6K8B3_9APIC|nr:DNA-dependent kinase catalytic subunit-like protein, putative [Babesia ovata]GBE59235.1 DNA-dependent kinase catalytic subunit-like protein, putative [Babesia ovata]
MDCSFLFGSQSITRLICAAIAYIGFSRFEKAECVGVKDAPASEILVSPQSVLPMNSLVSNIEVTKQRAPIIEECRIDADLAFNPATVGGKETLQRLHADEIAAIQAPMDQGVVRELNDRNALDFMQMVLNEHLPRKEFWLCWFRSRLRSITETSETPPTHTVVPPGDKFISPTGPSTGKNIRGAHDSDTPDTSTGVCQDAKASSVAESSLDDISRARRIWLFVTGLYATAKTMVFRDSKATDIPRPSLRSHLATFGRAVAGKVGRGVVSTVSTVSTVLGFNDTPFINMKHTIMQLFSPELKVKEEPEEPTHAALEEECFLEKMARLNAFYHHDIANRPIYADRSSFYGPLPKALNVTEAQAPFETARCRNAAHYVVVSSGHYATLSLYTLFAVMFLI